MKEKLKDIPRWEDTFEISNKGYVRNKKTGTIRYGSPGKKGYWRMVLSTGGKRQSIRIHRMVAEAFIPNPYNLPEVNHKDGIKSHNGENNLEWSTSSDNKIHGIANGLYNVNTQIKSGEELEVMAIIKRLKTMGGDSINKIYKAIKKLKHGS